MWIVKLALRRPYTFIVLALLLFILGPLAIMRTPTDIFPDINIPVVSIVWTYNGFSAEDMAHRITSNYERALTSDVDDIKHMESQSLNGVSVVKVFFHPGADINRAIAEAASNSALDPAHSAAGHAAAEHFTRSPGFLGISDGTTTWQSCLSSRSCRQMV